jgi:hypothetical protein
MVPPPKLQGMNEASISEAQTDLPYAPTLTDGGDIDSNIQLLMVGEAIATGLEDN